MSLQEYRHAHIARVHWRSDRRRALQTLQDLSSKWGRWIEDYRANQIQTQQQAQAVEHPRARSYEDLLQEQYDHCDPASHGVYFPTEYKLDLLIKNI